MTNKQASSELAINCMEASVFFGNFAAIKDINLEIKKHKITGLIGPSGAGKTTLMRAVVGRQKLSAGSIEVFGDIAGVATNRKRVSYKTQEVSAYEDLTVAENFRYFAAMRGVGKSNRSEAVAKIIDRIDLNPQADQLVADLSGGQRQRVSLGITLIGNPELLILDEPTVGLDPVLRDSLWQLFHKMSDEGITILISSHVMDEAERCDDLVLIRNGKLIAHETPQALVERTQSKNVEESFLKLATGGQA